MDLHCRLKDGVDKSSQHGRAAGDNRRPLNGVLGRPCGLVGYDVCLTRRRSPVRAWARIIFYPVKTLTVCFAKNAATGNRTQAIGATSRGTAPIL